MLPSCCRSGFTSIPKEGPIRLEGAGGLVTNYSQIAGFITRLTSGLTQIWQARGTVSRVIGPVTSSY